MKISARRVGNVNILDIDGTIDINSAELIEVIGELVRYKRLDILCNFKSVEQLDYNGLSILAIAYKNVINHNGRIRFCNVPIHILNLIKIAHLDNVFEIYDSEQTALRSFCETISQAEKKILRRRFKRLDLHIDVKYSILARPKRLYEGRLLNVSGAGVYVQTPKTFPVKTKLNLRIKLPDLPNLIEILGIVIWNADKEIQPHEYPGMGIQFTDISSEVQKQILEFIDKNISHRSGRGLYTE